MYVHACMHACMHAWMYVCMYVCTYLYVYVCMYACMYVCPPKKRHHLHTHSARQQQQQGPWQCKTLRRSSRSPTTRLFPHCSPCQDWCRHFRGSPPSGRRRKSRLSPHHEPKPHHSMAGRSMPMSRPVTPGPKVMEEYSGVES